jgi:hypothetical protein
MRTRNAHRYLSSMLCRSQEAVVTKALEIFHGKFDFFVKHIDRMDVLFGSSFAKLQDVGKPFTRCGKTRFVKSCYSNLSVSCLSASRANSNCLLIVDAIFN